MKLLHIILMTTLYIFKIRYIPAYLIFILYRNKFYNDFILWKKYHNINKKNTFCNFITLFDIFREYRSVFYFRLGFDSRLISWLAPGEQTLHIVTQEIGSGFFINHGHSTQINAKKIGENFQVWHNVTIGVATQFDNNTRPIIGNNVRICASAVVIGNITIGNNVTIGAGCVVVKSIPDNCIVVGNPARIIKN